MKVNKLFIKSIVVVYAIAMLLSCSNDVKQVEKYSNFNVKAQKYAKDLVLLYSDSLVLKYKVVSKEFVERQENNIVFSEFPKGVYIEIYEKHPLKTTIKSDYAIYDSSKRLWTAKYAVVINTSKGEKINTELMYWDQVKGLLYSDKYVRITTPDGQLMEGNNGFTYDQTTKDLELNEVTGDIAI